MRDKILDWFTGKDTFFLLGAGCSRCAGKPLISELTQKVVADIGDPAKTVFNRLKPAGGRAANIEDLMNHLIRRQELLANLDPAEKLGDLTKDDLVKLLGDIRKAVLKFVGQDWLPSDHHQQFLSRLRPSDGAVRDIFTLNYDTLLEASLDELRIPYSDGFRGSGKAWFDPATLDEAVSDEGRYTVQKLHGSVTWRREADEHFRRYIGATTTNDAVLVYPSEQKYVETRFGVYETLMARFRTRMRVPKPNNTLITLGYSFGDDHINEAIFDAICHRGSNLTLFAFVGPASGTGASDDQKKIFEMFKKRCGARLNAFVGNDFAISSAVEPTEALDIAQLGLWRFEAAVDLITGAGS